MKAIVVFTTPENWLPVSYLIMKVQGFDSSHCALIIKDETTDKSLVYEANMTNGVFVSDFESFRKHKKIKHEIEIDINKDTIEYLQSKLSYSYSFSAIFGFLVQNIFRLDNNPLDDEERAFVCSELVSRALGKSDYKFKKPHSDINVKDLFEELIK